MISEHVARWCQRIEPLSYFLCKPLFLYADTFVSLVSEATSSHERKALTKYAAFALKLFAKFQKRFKFGMFWFKLVEGRWHWINKKNSKASDCWSECLKSARTHRNTYEEALVLLEIGRHAKGQEYEQILAQSQQLFELLESPVDELLLKQLRRT